ncbi:MAG: 50S ribosomal protein L27 [Patescibacteria group bacterium]
MAHKKAGGSTSNVHDSQGQRLGTKLYGGQYTTLGGIIVRQRGTKIRPGRNVLKGSDDTLFSAIEGIVSFSDKKVRRFTGFLKKAKYVHVDPIVAKE